MDDKKTMTAEEVERVERAERTLKHALTAWSGDERDRAENALSRLAAQAARVPGLEKELAGATANFDRAASAAAESAKAHGLEIKRREQAESDRDEWRRRALGAEAERSDLAAKHLAALSERDAARERVVVLEQSERDLGGHVANLEKVLAAERESLRLSRENVTTLRERVATLEDERVASDASHRDTERALAAQRDTLEGCLEGAKAREDAVRERADTAESRVRELEAPSRALRDLLAAIHAYPRGLHSGDEDSTEHDEDCEGCLVEALKAMAEEVASVQVDASHPAPSPGLGSKYLREVLALAATARLDALRLFEAARELDALESRTSPTPPPGLLEAVGKLEWVWRETMRRHGRGMLAFPATYGEMEALLAAYDAAKGREPPVQGKPSILGALTGLGRALRANSGGIHTLVTLEVSREHYDAVACGLVGHEYTRVFADRIHCETGEVPVRIVNKSLTLATPPSGPGGGETKPETCGMARYVQHDVGPDHRITEPCSHPPKHGGLHSWEPAPRARIAPTPTPESLKETFAAIKRSNEEWDRKVAAGMSRCSYGNEGGPCRTAPEDNGWCKYHQHIAAIHEARTQSAPEVPPLKVEVVWEGAGLKVKADGSVWDTHEHRAPWQVTELLARALAEAKREVEGMRGERDAERQIAQEWEAKAYKAAESMRERAETLAYSAAAHCKDQGHKEVLLALGHRIADLPLEEK